MKIKQLEIENFRCKAAASLELGSRLTVLIGENGAGKTTFLDALSIALGTIITYLPKAEGRGFKERGEIRQTAGKTLPYARIAVETVDGIAWDCIKRGRGAKGKIPETGKRQLREYLVSTIIHPLESEQELDRKSTRLNSSHSSVSRMPSSA